MIYKSIANKLRIRIGTAEYAIGSALPGENKLAEEFSVSRMTIRKAVDLLVNWGLVFRKNGSGTFISHMNVYPGTENLAGFFESMKTLNDKLSSQVLIFQIQPASETVAMQLKITTESSVYFSRRVRFIDNIPMMLEDSYMPTHLFRNLSISHLEGSKFKYIEEHCRVKINGNYECLTPVLADSDISALLHVKENSPILCITSLTYSAQQEFINYSIMYRNTSEYRIDRYL